MALVLSLEVLHTELVIDMIPLHLIFMIESPETKTNNTILFIWLTITNVYKCEEIVYPKIKMMSSRSHCQWGPKYQWPSTDFHSVDKNKYWDNISLCSAKERNAKCLEQHEEKVTNNTEWNVSHTHTGPVSAHISSLVQRVFSVVIPCSAVSSGPGSCPVWKGTCPNSLQGSETHKAPAGYLTSTVPTHFCYTPAVSSGSHVLTGVWWIL